MRNATKAGVAVLLATVFAAATARAATPVVDYRFDTTVGKTLPNRAGAGFTGEAFGAFAPNGGDGAWRFNGIDSRVDIPGSERFDPLKGLTLTAVFRFCPEDKDRRALGIFLGQSGRLLFSLRDRRLYTLIGAENGTWNYPELGLLASREDAVEDFDFHHYTATFSRFTDTAQGVDYLEIRHYLDGRFIGSKRLSHVKMHERLTPLAIGVIRNSKEFAPELWTLAGGLASIRIFDRALSAAEVEKEVLSFPMVTPRFGLRKRELTDVDVALFKRAERRVRSVTGRAQLSALHNAALGGVDGWRASVRVLAERGELRSGEADVHTLDGPESKLTLLTTPGNARIAGWYDITADREILSWDNPWFSLIFKVGERAVTVYGHDEAIRAELAGAPERRGDAWHFTLRYRRNADKADGIGFTADSRYVFGRDRVEYDLNVDNASAAGRLAKVNLPLVRAAALTPGRDFAVVPRFGGQLLPDPARASITYAGDGYPSGWVSMAFCAYYDDRGGLYVGAEDPKARTKNFDFSADSERVRVAFEWQVPFLEPDGKNTFTSQANAALELFRGDWYDSGLVYRRVLHDIRAPWWTPELPAVETPAWLRDNTHWIGRYVPWQEHHDWRRALDDLAAWRLYLGLPGAIHLYNSGGKFTRDWPNHRIGPDFIERMRELQRTGYRVVPYVNARLFEEQDKRDEDHDFSRIGRPSIIVQEGGALAPEHYARRFFVICPVTETYQDVMRREFNNFAAVGVDGLYADEVGSATPFLCFNREHGHPLADDEAWYVKGHRRLFSGIRAEWKNNYPDAVFMSEYVSDGTIGLFDAALISGGAWNIANAIPLFTLVYSGRVQLVGQHWGSSPWEETDIPIRSVDDYRRFDDAPYAYAKLSAQLLLGQQFGWFPLNYLKAPERHHFRVGVKQFCHLRHALLDFFNEGMLARAPRFAHARTAAFSAYWGRSRDPDRLIHTPPMMAGAWTRQERTVFMVVNVTEEEQANTLLADLPEGPRQLHIFTSDGTERSGTCDGKLEWPLRLPPRAFAVALVAPADHNVERWLGKMEATFATIRRAESEPDPFAEAVFP